MKREISKEFLTGFINKKYIFSSPYNELDGFLNGNLSKYHFGNESLYDFYKKRGFNYNCQIGSLLCILNFPDELECYLIRGELLSDIEGKMFVHGWIEVSYKGKEYVVDTSVARAIPKELYYKVYSPVVYTCIERKELLQNEYVKYFKQELRHTNDFTLSRQDNNMFYGEGSWFDLYENYWLQNIKDNSKVANSLTRIKNS